VRPHLRYSSNRLISALRLSSIALRGHEQDRVSFANRGLFLALLDMVHEGSGSSETQGGWPPLGLGVRGAKPNLGNPTLCARNRKFESDFLQR
jgi:hypothetical protein